MLNLAQLKHKENLTDFFEILNTRNLDETYYKLKSDLRAYKNKNDTDFEVRIC